MTRYALMAVIAAVLLAATSEPLPAQAADPVAERFERATHAMATGAYRQAAEAMAALATEAPAHPVADDALFTAAQLYEEKLTEPARALALYQQLLAAYPDSRTALAARRRADEIRAQLGPSGAGDQALARFTDVLQHFPERPEAESLAKVQALLAEFPDWPGRPRALVWLASQEQRQGRLDTALARYLEAAKAAEALGDEESLFAAYRGAGDVSLAQNNYLAAEQYYRRLPSAGDVSRQRTMTDLLVDVDRARIRQQLYYVAFGLIAFVILALGLLLKLSAGSWAAAWQALRRPPTEVIFMAPIAGLLIFSSFTGHYAIAPAVILVCTGGLIVTWLSGAGLTAAAARNARFRLLRALAHAFLCTVAVIALCYVALQRNRLVDMILETVRFGPDV